MATNQQMYPYITDGSVNDNNDEITNIKRQLDYYTSKYVTGQGEITDEEFDALESKYHYLTGEKYNQNAADEDGDEPLPFKCGSQDKIKDASGDKNLQTFLSRYNVDQLVMDKYDGITVVVEYTGNIVNDQYQIKCWKKKNENKGPRVDYIAQYSQFPQLSYKMLIRGELIIDDNDFNTLKPYLESIGMKATHSRNIVNAATSRVNPNTTLLPYCKFIPYSLYITKDQPEYGITARQYTQTEQLEILKVLGFRPALYTLYKHDQITRQILLDYLDYRKKNAGYRIDGTILCANIPVGTPTSGENPDYSVAIKNDTIGFARVTGCSFSFESKDGKVVPVIQIVPTILITEVTNITMYNGKQLIKSGVTKGALVAFTQGGDIVPKFLWLVEPGDGIQFQPSIPYHFNKTGTDMIADNADQYPQVRCAKMKYFLDTLGVKEWGLLTIWKLYQTGMTDLDRLIHITPEQILACNIDGIKITIANNLVHELHRGILNSNWAKIMAGSCFFDSGLAETTMQKFIVAFPQWRYSNITYDQIFAVPGFGPVKSAQIANGLPLFQEWLATIPGFEAAIPKPKEIIIKSHALSGKVFYFTGDKNQMLQEEIKSFGGKIEDNMVNAVNVVVRKDTTFNSAKTEKAKNSGGVISLITIQELDTYLRQLRMSS